MGCFRGVFGVHEFNKWSQYPELITIRSGYMLSLLPLHMGFDNIRTVVILTLRYKQNGGTWLDEN